MAKFKEYMPTPTNSISITTNGTHDVKQYANASVNVPQTTVSPITITTNGTTTAPSGTAYSPITVNVPSSSSGSHGYTIKIAGDADISFDGSFNVIIYLYGYSSSSSSTYQTTVVTYNSINPPVAGSILGTNISAIEVHPYADFEDGEYFFLEFNKNVQGNDPTGGYYKTSEISEEYESWTWLFFLNEDIEIMSLSAYTDGYEEEEDEEEPIDEE